MDGLLERIGKIGVGGTDDNGGLFARHSGFGYTLDGTEIDLLGLYRSLHDFGDLACHFLPFHRRRGTGLFASFLASLADIVLAAAAVDSDVVVAVVDGRSDQLHEDTTDSDGHNVAEVAVENADANEDGGSAMPPVLVVAVVERINVVSPDDTSISHPKTFPLSPADSKSSTQIKIHPLIPAEALHLCWCHVVDLQSMGVVRLPQRMVVCLDRFVEGIRGMIMLRGRHVVGRH